MHRSQLRFGALQQCLQPCERIAVLVSLLFRLLERMADFGGDCMGIDWTVDMTDARKRIGDDLAMQGNMDPCVLFTDKDTIYRHVDDIIEKAGGLSAKHVMNLGHGVMQKTPEENVGHFFEACRTAHLRK